MKRAIAIVILFAVTWPINSQAQPDPKRAKACEKTFNAYYKLGFAYDLDASTGEIVLYAGPGFFAAPIKAKRLFAETVSCRLVKGDPHLLAEFTITHWQTGKRFGRFHYGSLEID